MRVKTSTKAESIVLSGSTGALIGFLITSIEVDNRPVNLSGSNYYYIPFTKQIVTMPFIEAPICKPIVANKNHLTKMKLRAPENKNYIIDISVNVPDMLASLNKLFGR
jgi:hypothetical protein